jgi:hypothetical protein
MLIAVILLLNLTKYSTSLILKREIPQKDLAIDNKRPERKLVVMDVYEERRKDYEAAKCKHSWLYINHS